MFLFKGDNDVDVKSDSGCSKHRRRKTPNDDVWDIQLIQFEKYFNVKSEVAEGTV